MPIATGDVVTAHRERVSRVVSAVKSKPPGVKLSVRKPTPGHQIHNGSWRKQCHRVDVSALDQILSIEDGVDRAGVACKLAVCEGQVSLQQLVQTVLPLGLLPYCIPEFPDFTIAGLINGEGIQSSAFRYGFFTYGVTEIEIVLGNGDVVTATSSNAYADLFANMAGSYGTLGIVTRATVCLRPALSYVRSEYRVFDNVAEFVRVFDATVRSMQGQFLEGIVFSPQCYVMIHSHFASEPGKLPTYDPHPLRTDTGERYYYQYLQQVVLDGNQLRRKEDIIPTESFVFRSCRGYYWALEMFIGWKALTNMKWFRRLCDRKAKEKVEKHGFVPSGYLTAEETQRCVVNQDMGIKLNRLEEGIRYVQDNLGVYPLWLCPASLAQSLAFTPEQLAMHPGDKKILGDGFLVDIGVYGEPTVKPFYHRRAVKALQEFVDAPSKWGVSYQNKEALRLEWAPIRAKYHAVDAFPGVEDKTTFRGDEDAANMETSIPNWRLVDQHGWYWYIKLPAIVAVALGVVAALCWGLIKTIIVLFHFV